MTKTPRCYKCKSRGHFTSPLNYPACLAHVYRCQKCFSKNWERLDSEKGWCEKCRGEEIWLIKKTKTKFQPKNN